MALRIGLAVGHGTGHELAQAFRRVIADLSAHYGLDTTISQSPRIYHSYASLLASHGVHAETRLDADHYVRYCLEEAKLGTKVIFRTSFSAQALYDVRERLDAVKVELYSQGASSLMVVRDQAQGFYAGTTSFDPVYNTLYRTSQLRRDVMDLIVDYSVTRARNMWADDGLDSIILVYKHHLFNGILDNWADEWSRKYAVPVTFVQPDTNNRNLLAFGLQQRRQLMITANEYSDITQVFLLDMFGGEVQETSCSENVYLCRDLPSPLSEYQTVHGSADELEGIGSVNPTATARAAAAILEHFGGCKGVESAVHAACHLLARQNALTPDQGGSLSTEEFVSMLIDTTRNLLHHTYKQEQSGTVQRANTRLALLSQHVAPTVVLDPLRLTQGRKSAIIVVDWQNDMVNSTGPGIKFPHSPEELAAIGNNISRLLSHARNMRVDVVFVRFLGDEKFTLPNWKYRDGLYDRTTGCHENTQGAEIAAPLKPLPGEAVFDKYAYYDAFLNRKFEQYFLRRKIEHLIFVGVYADICVGVTLTTAFQKGYFTTEVEDCTATLRLGKTTFLDHVRRMCGTRIVDTHQLLAMET